MGWVKVVCEILDVWLVTSHAMLHRDATPPNLSRRVASPRGASPRDPPSRTFLGLHLQNGSHAIVIRRRALRRREEHLVLLLESERNGLEVI